MAMPMGPLVVISPAFVAPYETTFLLQERVGRELVTVSRTHLSSLVSGVPTHARAWPYLILCS